MTYVMTEADQDLFKAVEQNNTADIETALSQHANIEAINADGQTPLIAAIYGGKDIAIQTLLEKGANIEFQGPLGTALGYAVDNDDHKLAELILRKNANPNAKIKGGSNPTPFFYVKSKKMAELLLKYGADIDAQDMFLDTPLSYVIERHDTKMLQTLLDLGANTELTNGLGHTALYAAAEISNWQMGYALLRAGAEHKEHTNISLWLAQMEESVEKVFLSSKIPIRKQCFTKDRISDDVLDACVTGQFTTLIAAPLLASAKPEDRQLFKDIWDQLPQYWQNRYSSLHTQFVKTGGLQPAMGHHTGAITSATDAVRGFS